MTNVCSKKATSPVKQESMLYSKHVDCVTRSRSETPEQRHNLIALFHATMYSLFQRTL